MAVWISSYLGFELSTPNEVTANCFGKEISPYS